MISNTKFSIELFFVTGDPNGMVKARIPVQWTGDILVFRRTEIKEALNQPEARGAGVYFLVDDDQSKIYVGESENISKRIIDHSIRTKWWSSVILITSTKEKLNKAHCRYLEYRLHEQIDHLKKINLANENKPKGDSLSESDTASMDAFLENIFLVLPTLRFDFLTDQTKSRSPQENDRYTDDVVRFEYKFTLKGIEISARSRIDNGQFIVESGSRTVKEWRGDNEHIAAAKLFHNLIKQGILIENDKFYEFCKDCIFSSPSAAMSVVVGKDRSGRRYWKVVGSKKTYAEWESDTLRKNC